MTFYPQQLFHIYNQGNNKRQIFFTHEHYQFFMWKMKAYLLPFGDLVSYCLMPNHFHFQFYVQQTAITRNTLWTHVDKIELARRRKKYGRLAVPPDFKQTRIAQPDEAVTLNQAIGILQRTYTRALNLERAWSGSLFRKACKAKDGWIDEFVTVDNNGRLDGRFRAGSDYAYQCFMYIHENPSKAGLVNQKEEWAYSSAMDYAGLRKRTMCNLTLGKEILAYV